MQHIFMSIKNQRFAWVALAVSGLCLLPTWFTAESGLSSSSVAISWAGSSGHGFKATYGLATAPAVVSFEGKAGKFRSETLHVSKPGKAERSPACTNEHSQSQEPQADNNCEIVSNLFAENRFSRALSGRPFPIHTHRQTGRTAQIEHIPIALPA